MLHEVCTQEQFRGVFCWALLAHVRRNAAAGTGGPTDRMDRRESAMIVRCHGDLIDMIKNVQTSRGIANDVISECVCVDLVRAVELDITARGSGMPLDVPG